MSILSPWELKRRIKSLNEFIPLWKNYMSVSKDLDTFEKETQRYYAQEEKKKIKELKKKRDQLREKINLDLLDVVRYIEESGIKLTSSSNIFSPEYYASLDRDGRPFVVDVAQMAVGVYSKSTVISWVLTVCNVFWWIWQLIFWLLYMLVSVFSSKPIPHHDQKLQLASKFFTGMAIIDFCITLENQWHVFTNIYVFITRNVAPRI